MKSKKACEILKPMPELVKLKPMKTAEALLKPFDATAKNAEDELKSFVESTLEKPRKAKRVTP